MLNLLKMFPNGNKGKLMTRLFSAADFGAFVRARRKELGYSQQQLAEFCGCGVRFISDLENGKETMQFGKAVLVASMLGLNLYIEPRTEIREPNGSTR